MNLSLGIVGLPNVGKSTLFNALLKKQVADVANYPFCTIEPNSGVVAVPDPRLDRLAAITKPERIVPATVKFVDIAGLVKGASQGEGLGNKFLSHIREVSAMIHVVRVFEDSQVVHVGAGPDPKSDIATIETELALADLASVEKRLAALTTETRAKKPIERDLNLLKILNVLNLGLSAGTPARQLLPTDEDRAFVRDLNLLTAKPVLYALNISEPQLKSDIDYTTYLEPEIPASDVVVICGKLESDLNALSESDRAEYLKASSITESGLEQLIHKGYAWLGLISFFTNGPKEARAWTIKKGERARDAAGEIHTEISRGFIAAEVIPYAKYIEAGSEVAAKARGWMKLEGEDYIVEDGDVIFFRFSV